MTDGSPALAWTGRTTQTRALRRVQDMAASDPAGRHRTPEETAR